MPKLSLSLLGSFVATLDERPLTAFETQKTQALLVYLVCQPDQAHPREALMTLLWPDMPLPSAQSNMRQTLYRLRKLIPEVQSKHGDEPVLSGAEVAVPFLLSNRQTIQINPDADYFLDVAIFDKGNPAQAIPLYRGDFLADFFLPDSEPFEEWAAGRRAAGRRRVLELLAGETAVHIQNANYDQAINLARQQLTIDNLRESGHCQLMEALARNGRRQEALAHYNHLCQLLQTELAIEPSQETRALIETIRVDAFDRPVTPVKQPLPLARPKHNLPQRLTSFIGRQQEIADIIALMSQNRLVMLTGVGGIGKTNLSLQLGRSLVATFPDGVWLVELAPVADPKLVPDTTAAALGLRESTDRPTLTLLLDYLRPKQCLLILDNCEHLIQAVAQFVQTILQRCPEVKILATSREILAVPGERPYPVPSLSLPNNHQPSHWVEWQQYDALRLFVERTQLVLPDFQVTPDNMVSLAQICQHLDGIPLALELAAARMKLLTTAQIATRLDDRFRLLTGGQRTALPRHQTLRALIDWSWELLTESEKLLLPRLSVFAGGMQLEAVEVICAGEGLATDDLLDVLNELVNKSLVIAQRQQGQETRYQLLETIRQYAHGRLAAAGQVEKYCQHHLVYWQQFAEKAAPRLMKSKQALWLNRVQRELGNIRAALLWAQAADVETGLKLIWALTYFCWARGYYSEMETRLTQLLSKSEAMPSHLKARALWTQGVFNAILDRYDRACPAFEESLALFYRLENDPVGLARTLRMLGYSVAVTREFSQGQAFLQESLALLRPLPDQAENKVELAETLLLLGEIETWEYPERARPHLQESELLLREIGDFGRLAWNLGKSGTLAMQEGEFETAQAMFEESLALQEMLDLRESGFTLVYLGNLHTKLGNYPLAEAYYERILSNYGQTEYHGAERYASVELGNVYLHQGKLDQAEQLFIKSQSYFKGLEDLQGVAYSLERLASVAVRRHKLEKAVHLYAWADTMRQGKRPLTEQEDVDRDITAVRELLDEETFDAAHAAGQAMTVEEAIALALQGNVDKAQM